MHECTQTNVERVHGYPNMKLLNLQLKLNRRISICHCPMDVSFFWRSMREEKKTKTINPAVDKQSKCFGEIFKERLTLLKNLEIF